VTAPVDRIAVVLDAVELLSSEVALLSSGAGMALSPAAVFDVTGPGAVTCVQGLLTNDIEAPGDAACIYAAVLTPKGMIRTDLWAWRFAGGIRLIAPANARAELLDILTRTLPPRLARFSDHGEAARVYWLVGPRAADAAARAGLPVPEPGRVAVRGEGAGTVLMARPAAGPAPFALGISTDQDGAHLLEALERAGASRVSPAVLELARIAAGWPRLGAEIDDKTLPQEVRFDEIGGVSYSKGCYTGQETVARLHFRGHANRGVVGLTWESAPNPDRSDVVQGAQPLGAVTSAAWLDHRRQWIGLAKVRRELDRTRPFDAAGAPATVTELPFTLS